MKNGTVLKTVQGLCDGKREHNQTSLLPFGTVHMLLGVSQLELSLSVWVL